MDYCIFYMCFYDWELQSVESMFNILYSNGKGFDCLR